MIGRAICEIIHFDLDFSSFFTIESVSRCVHIPVRRAQNEAGVTNTVSNKGNETRFHASHSAFFFASEGALCDQ